MSAQLLRNDFGINSIKIKGRKRYDIVGHAIRLQDKGDHVTSVVLSKVNRERTDKQKTAMNFSEKKSAIIDHKNANNDTDVSQV